MKDILFIVGEDGWKGENILIKVELLGWGWMGQVYWHKLAEICRSIGLNDSDLEMIHVMIIWAIDAEVGVISN